MNSSLKILHLIGQLDWFDHSEQMRLLSSAQKRSGCLVDIIAFAGEQVDCDNLAEQGIGCRIVRRRWSRDPFMAHQLRRIVGAAEPQVVHCWGSDTAEFAAIIRWAAPHCRIIATLEKPLPDRILWIPGTLQAIDELLTDVPVFPASALRPLRYISPAIAPAVPTASRAEFLSRLGLPFEAKLIMTASPLERAQRLDEALWNFELVRTLIPETCFLVVGSGPDRIRLQRYCRLVTESNAIRYLHPREWYPEVLSYADLYWYPGSTHRIPTGMLHALAAGVPVLGHDQPALQAVIRPNKNGWLVPTENRAVATRLSVKALTDSSEAHSLGEGGHQTYRDRYTREQFLQSYGERYGFVNKISVA